MRDFGKGPRKKEVGRNELNYLFMLRHTRGETSGWRNITIAHVDLAAVERNNRRLSGPAKVSSRSAPRGTPEK